MKERVLTFIIGLLVGAIITTSGFLIYNKVASNNATQPEMQMNGNGQMGGGQPGNMSEPPEKPSGDDGQEPPAKPEEINNNTSN